MKRARVIISADIEDGFKKITFEFDNCIFVCTRCKIDKEASPHNAVILENREVDEFKKFLREWAGYDEFKLLKQSDS